VTGGGTNKSTSILPWGTTEELVPECEQNRAIGPGDGVWKREKKNLGEDGRRTPRARDLKV